MCQLLWNPARIMLCALPGSCLHCKKPRHPSSPSLSCAGNGAYTGYDTLSSKLAGMLNQQIWLTALRCGASRGGRGGGGVGGLKQPMTIKSDGPASNRRPVTHHSYIVDCHCTAGNAQAGSSFLYACCNPKPILKTCASTILIIFQMQILKRSHDCLMQQFTEHGLPILFEDS